MNTTLETLRARLGEISDMQAALALLSWDQETYMPPAAAEARATQLATLATTAHDWFVADEVGQLLADLQAELRGADYDSFEASLIRVTRREYDRERKLPSHLVSDLARAASLGEAAWERARPASDFPAFQPYLETIVDLTIQKADALGYDDCLYDALLDEYEPGMTSAQVQRLFDEMKAGLVPLMQAIAQRQNTVDGSILSQEYDEKAQWDFGVEVLRQIGFDFQRGRQDLSAHPFTTSFTPADVRVTTRIQRNRLAWGLLSSIHEGGHGLYEQGVDRVLDRTPLSCEASMGVHESQSRMWENLVGRGRPFWTFWLPRLQAVFPAQLAGVGNEAFYRAINRVEPSFIRTEADEVTYNLHILLRFEIETLMLERKVRIADLPQLWNDKMEEYLGIRPPNDAYGVLQDIHWADGIIGYFPSYTLGNLLSVLFYDRALADIPEIPAQLAAGQFAPLLTWLREKIHVHGAKYTAAELVQRVTGGPFRTGPFLNYIERKYSELYDL